jgi:hypothetical protein
MVSLRAKAKSLTVKISQQKVGKEKPNHLDHAVKQGDQFRRLH